MLQIQRKICFNVNNIFLQKCKKRECRVYNFLFKRYVSTSLSERELILVTTDFFIAFPQKLYKFSLFLKLGSLQVLHWNLRQLISYFFALIIYSINLLKTDRKTFATGNAIYPLPRTIIQIINENSIFRKEGIVKSHLKLKLEQYKLNKTGVISGCQSS